MSEQGIVYHFPIVMPSKAFLIGALYGFNAARRRLEQNPQPLYNNQQATNQDIFLGSWLEITCAKCGCLYTFDNPNEIPEGHLTCTGKDSNDQSCNNLLIYYGVVDSNLWRIGPITFV